MSMFEGILGPIISAAFFTVFFFGVITMQTEHYIRSHFRNDLLFVKCFVVSLWFLHLLFTICICQAAYTRGVSDFGNAIGLLSTPWGLKVGIFIGSIIDHSVQAFFVTRVYRVTGALYVSIGLWTFVAFLQGVSLKMAQELLNPIIFEPYSHWLLSALFFGDASLDVVTASLLIYYLKKQSQSAFKSTAALLNRLVRYTIQTGLVTSFVAIAAALSFKISPESFIWVAFWISMPGSFSIALLANINNRSNLIAATNSNSLESEVVIIYSRDVVVGFRSVYQQTNDQGLGSLHEMRRIPKDRNKIQSTEN
ncbi:hypothetical protein B0H19DRAFT_1113352 [Mycena capillaripes]|nr:hypothetical protein B0H19DRAFT_1113352 [Mycena capillaripes]